MAAEGESDGGFKRENFSSYTKPQLIDYIQQQAESIERYEARFRDVVRAYKGLLKEKEALENTLQVLSASRSTPTRDRLHKRADKSHDVTMSAESEGERSEQEGGGGENGETSALEESDSGNQEGVDDQVMKLMQSLSVLTEEKSKMETSFQQDKKRLLSQLDTMSVQFSSEKDELLDEVTSLRQQLEETLSKLLTEEKERKKEETEHGEMVRELQQYLNKERERSETLDNKLKDAHTQIQTLHKQDRTKEYEEKVQSLSKELENVGLRLEASEKQSREPPPLLLRLQEDMKAMKLDHELSLANEEKRANEAELKLQQQAKLEEERVASLEAKLSELSEIVGKYDKQRVQDQEAILRLRDRITQLDSENTALTKANIESNAHVNNELMEQLGQLQDKVSKLRQLLKVATLKILEERSTLPANLEDMTVAEYSDLLSREPLKVREEMSELRHEFESYKQKAQSVLRAKSNKEYESNKELYGLQEKYEGAMETVERLEKEKEEMNERHSITLQKLRAELRLQAEKHSQELLQAELEHKQKLQELQQHVQSTRERTRCLLEEKEKELMTLRRALGGERGGVVGGVRLSHSMSRQSSSSNGDDDRLRETVETPPVSAYSVNRREERNSIRGGGGGSFSSNIVQELTEQTFPVSNDVQLYLHSQEKQRLTDEISSIRSRKLELEDSLRDLTEREQRHVEQNMLLKEEIRKLERDRSRETENLEYLKNVIFHFMCSDSGREQLIVPIATILHFTPNEIRAVKRKLSSRSWIISSPYK